MISYINPSHVSEEYEQRLQESARNARFRSPPREFVVRQTLGRLIISLGEYVHGQRPATVDEPASVRWATN